MADIMSNEADGGNSCFHGRIARLLQPIPSIHPHDYTAIVERIQRTSCS